MSILEEVINSLYFVVKRNIATISNRNVIEVAKYSSSRCLFKNYYPTITKSLFLGVNSCSLCEYPYIIFVYFFNYL
ncbi:MAG: hypothetical protein B6V02_03060 [Thermoprotei archaeon ex4572_64]|nr:MAG: hypothetical protein B6V02_03060 [Thermoprotei archaeon ex4572_64]